jgi:hypothetical protein
MLVLPKHTAAHEFADCSRTLFAAVFADCSLTSSVLIPSYGANAQEAHTP